MPHVTHMITLDLATRIGWTAGRLDAARPAFGDHVLPSTGEDIGAFGEAYADWFVKFVQRTDGLYSDTRVVFEAPILPKETKLITIRKLHGIAFYTEVLCHELGLDCSEVHLQQVKRFWAGHGRADKDAMVVAAQGFGFNVENHDQADALAVRFYTISREHPEQLPKDFGLGRLANAVLRG